MEAPSGSAYVPDPPVTPTPPWADAASDLPRVDVHIVTYQSARTIVPCVEAVLAQRGFVHGRNLVVRISDNASTDGSADVVASAFGDRVHLERHIVNLGFCGGQNAGIAAALAAGAEYVLVLNPDVRLEVDAVATLVARLSSDPSAGWATPRMYRAERDLTPVVPHRFDTTGMFVTPDIRHFDRGSEEIDVGQYDQPQYVFGASGAAALLKRAFIEDLALPGGGSPVQLFDEQFFAYREDADLAWRAQWKAWRCLYVPAAVGYHVRHVLPERRKLLPAELNAFGVRNRFLLQLNNLSVPLAIELLPRWMIRNIIVVCAATLLEPASRRALFKVVKHLGAATRNRRIVLRSRRTSAFEISRWFKRGPYAEPALLDAVASDRRIRSITAVIVSYNSGERVERALESVEAERMDLASSGVDLSTVVVDNASLDGSAERARVLIPKLSTQGACEVIALSDNIGFGPALNMAFRRHPSDALLVLNPDVRIRQGALSALVAALDRHPELAAVAPVLLGYDGRPQFGFTARRFPTIGSLLAELFFLHRLIPTNPWTTRYHLTADPILAKYLARDTTREPYVRPDRPYVVEQPAGACLLVRGEDFDAVSGFDERFVPAWYEDVDLLKRIRVRGRLAAILRDAEVEHEGGYSLKVIERSSFYEIFFRNLVRYVRVHGTPVERRVFNVLLVPALLLRSLAAAIAGLFSPRQRRERLSAATTLLRLALGGAWR